MKREANTMQNNKYIYYVQTTVSLSLCVIRHALVINALDGQVLLFSSSVQTFQMVII